MVRGGAPVSLDRNDNISGFGRPHRRGVSSYLYDAVNDEIEGVLAGHILLTEKARGGAVCLGEYRYKKFCTGPCRTTPPLCIVRRALNHALKASSVFGLAAAVVDYDRFQIVIDIMI
jgi:hypothetical protein